MSKEVILTGLRSNAEFHLGNYLGAILPMVELQKKHAGKYQLNMFIPDLHSFTTPVDHGSLYKQGLQNLKAFVAAGLDINQQDTYVYRQSYIPGHSELTWILDCFSYFEELSRMTEFKEKGIRQTTDGLSFSDSIGGAQRKEVSYPEVSVGLFNYPVLMAADILLYEAKWVPVGEDQRQHVEFTRDLAIRMNNKFDNLFVVPEDNTKQMEFVGHHEPVRIRSLRHPEKKMSKSVDDPAGTIMLVDKPEEAAKKVMSATTDSLNHIKFDWEKQPGVTNLLQILALLTDVSQTKINQQMENKTSYDELKSAVAEEVRSFLSDFQAKLVKVDETGLLEKLEADEKAMNKVANATLVKVQRAVGLRPSN